MEDNSTISMSSQSRKGVQSSETDQSTEAAQSAEEHATERSAASRQAQNATELLGDDLIIGYSSSETPVINGESIEVQSGAITALIGPNGSGKSTLLKALANQLAPTDGNVVLDGRDIQTLETKELARKMGLLSQESTSPDSITVEDLVYHGRYPHRGFFESVTDTDKAAVSRAIELAGVDHLREREVGSLSGGQKQLVWIAMVLAQETDVLLLDEPTTFLDLHHQLEVIEIVETLQNENERTVVIVLHDIAQAARYTDRVIALQDGEIQARGPPVETITEDLLDEVFEIEATIEHTESGPQITPHCAVHEDSNDTPK